MTDHSQGASALHGAEPSPPAAEYRRRLAAREALVAQLSRKDASVGAVRLILVLAALALLAWWHHTHAIPWWPALLPVACFVPVAAWHARLLHRRTLAQRGVAFYQAGLARVEDRWAGSGQAEPRGSFAGSLFAADLDLFGKTSLFALLSSARTRTGEDTLAAWLLAPAPVEEVLARQAAVAELRPRVDLREEIAVLGEDAAAAAHTDRLVGWAEAPVVLHRPGFRYVALFLAVLEVAALAIWALAGLRAPFFALLVVAIGVHYAHRRRVTAILSGSERTLAGLALVRDVLTRLEREPCAAPALRRLQAALLSEGIPASKAIGELSRIGAYADSRDNFFLRLLNVPLLYTVQLGYLAEGWRRRHGGAVRRWLAAMGELEALLSLAAYSAEHPADPFPELLPGEPCFVAQALGHPLLPAARCVANDVRLGSGKGGEAGVLLISGSNMSGKSTLLRAVGLNTVLAMAGAPVRAARLRMTPLAVGASILVNDSLAEGSSRFYAEIQRLRAICDRAHSAPPLLFLLDELLEGTNSHDRRVGAEGILRTLAASGAIGLATTHDLALTQLENGGPENRGFDNRGRTRNMHFEDTVADGRMQFDYRLREGVVTRSNAVALMRLVGLDV